MTVIVGVDGAGRSRRLGALAAAAGTATVDIQAGTASPDALRPRLDTAQRTGALVLVDDVHLLGADVMSALTAAARTGVAMVIARRPTIERPELAELDAVVAGRGGVEMLAPLDLTGITALLAELTGHPPEAGAAASLLAASCGMPAIAAALAGSGSSEGLTVTAALAARVQRRMTTVDEPTAALARTLALVPDLTDDVLSVAAGLAPDGLASAMRTLRDCGVLAPDGERLIPAVAAAALSDLSPAGRRRVHDRVARALAAVGAAPVTAARHLRTAHVWTPAAADLYRAAGDLLRFTRPAEAVDWYDDAAHAGADPPSLVAGRSEAAAVAGIAAGPDVLPVGAADVARVAMVDGAGAAHQGRAGRAADLLLTAGPSGRWLAVPALVGAGRLAEARTVGAETDRSPTAPCVRAPTALRVLAEAALTVDRAAVALPLFIEAAEAAERQPLAAVLPDTPHALGALTAVAAGDVATAEALLGRALDLGVGGPVFVARHRLLLAWVRLRSGRYDTAITELVRFGAGTGAPPTGTGDATRLAGRDRFLLAALSAGVARRSGDVTRLRAALASVEQALARRAFDVFHVEVIEELVVSATRLRRRQHVAPVLAAVDAVLVGLGRPPVWTVAAAWMRLQVAAAADDADAVAVAAHDIAVAQTGGEPRQLAQATAAACWAQTVAGTVEPDTVLAAVNRLATVGELPWEASRLAGQAAIRTTDPSAARRLLERARELSAAESGGEPGRRDAPAGGLSERETEVARLVLAGRTYREIGAQLYISAKTVEHHVARIRTKLGATTRAEFVAAVRAALATPLGQPGE